MEEKGLVSRISEKYFPDSEIRKSLSTVADLRGDCAAAIREALEEIDKKVHNYMFGLTTLDSVQTASVIRRLIRSEVEKWTGQ